jgi:hypothetical protein
MPVARRIPKVRLDVEVDPTTWAVMTDEIHPNELEGWDRLVVVFGDTLPAPNFRTAWDAHADEIVATWARDHPGSRPSLWWRWTAPEQRRVLAEPEVLAPFRGDEEEVAYIESEAAFLRRHDLLLDGEAALLGEADYAPVEMAKTPQAWACEGQHGVPRRSAALRRLARSEAPYSAVGN